MVNCMCVSPNELDIGYRSVKGLKNEWFIAATFKLANQEMVNRHDKKFVKC